MNTIKAMIPPLAISKIIATYHFEDGGFVALVAGGSTPSSEVIEMAHTLVELKRSELVDVWERAEAGVDAAKTEVPAEGKDRDPLAGESSKRLSSLSARTPSGDSSSSTATEETRSTAGAHAQCDSESRRQAETRHAAQGEARQSGAVKQAHRP